jgi:signal transduction histidine kinase
MTDRLQRVLDLRGRVTLATALVLALGLALLTGAAMLLLSHQLDRDADSALRERADAQLAALTVADGRVVLRRVGGAREPVDQQAWVYAGGRALHRPAARPALQRAADALARVPAPAAVTVEDEVRLRAEPVHASGRGPRLGAVVVGISLAPYDRTEHRALVAMLGLDLCIVAFGALLARRAVGKALRPVADMTAQAAEWSEHDLDRRFALGPPHDELTALSATLDALLARIASSLRHEQRFSAEMAHELRTPLSTLRGEAELALRAADTPPEVHAALEQILRGTDRMQTVIDALLAAARGGAEGSVGTSDARAAAQQAIEAIRPAAERDGVAVELTTRDGAGPAAAGTRATLRVGAERQLVAQALAPLLDNAVRHARGTVVVALARARGDVVLSVEDDGQGIEAADVEAIFEPGASGSGGAGLGLPLARRLARAAGGEVTAEPSDGGGRVVLRLPGVG